MTAFAFPLFVLLAAAAASLLAIWIWRHAADRDDVLDDEDW